MSENKEEQFGLSDAEIIIMFDDLYYGLGARAGNPAPKLTVPHDETILAFVQKLARKAKLPKEQVGITPEMRKKLQMLIDTGRGYLSHNDETRWAADAALGKIGSLLNALEQPTSEVVTLKRNYADLEKLHANQRETIKRLQEQIEAIRVAVEAAIDLAQYGTTRPTATEKGYESWVKW